MTIVQSPFQQAATEGVTGHSYVFAKLAIQAALQERIDALGLGWAQFAGDLVGLGSDTLKITNVSGVGYDEAFTTMSSETQSIPVSSMVLDSDTMTIARHGLRKQASYGQQMADAGRPEAMTLDQLVAVIPDSVMRTILEKVCGTGATFAAATGSTGVDWDLDDELALVAAFEETEGAGGRVITIRHPKQYTQLRASLKSSGFYASSADFQSFQSRSGDDARPGGSLDGLFGFDNFKTNRVTDDATDYQGFAYQEGAVGWVRSNTAPIRPANPETALYVGEYGLLIERAGSADQATSEFVANLWLGAGKVSSTVRAQRRVISGL